MRRTILALLALTLALSLLAGCGGTGTQKPTDPPAVQTPEETPEAMPEQTPKPGEPGDTPRTTGFFDGGYISFTAENGWYVAEVYGDEGDLIYFIQCEDNYGIIQMEYRTYITLEKLSQSTAATWKVEEIGETTINGFKYKLIKVDDEAYFLLTSCGTFDEQKRDSVLIKVLYIALDEAIPFLETISTYEIS